jgi:hypothetical protein
VTVEEFAHHLRAAKQNGNGWIAKCPAHDDRAPSLSVREGDDGRVLVHCHAGCSVEEIVEAMGVSVSDLFEDEAIPIGPRMVVGRNDSASATNMPPISPSEIYKMHEALTPRQRGILRDERCLSDEVIDHHQVGVTVKHGAPRVTIPICNAAGEFEDVRCWLHPRRRGNGSPKILHWEKGYGGARLYPIDMLQHKELVLVAGELDALAMISNGFKAITATAGESTWPDSLSVQIAEAGVEEIIVVPDNDDTGAVGARKRAQSLLDAGVRVKVAAWPHIRDDGWDVSDELLCHGLDGLVAIIDAATAYERIEPDKEDESEEGISQAAALVELAVKEAELFHDQHDTPYARIAIGNRQQIVRCRSAIFRRWLNSLAYDTTRRVPGSEAFNSALNVIEAKAFRAAVHELGNRVAHVAHGDGFWYDIGDGTAFRIDAAGYEHQECPPILFASYAHQQAQVHPTAGDVYRLFDFIKITDADHQLLTAVWLVTALVPDIPHPVLVAHGPQGSGKSSACRIIRSMVDPSSLGTMSLPRHHNELVQKLAHHYVAPFDNIDNLSSSQSDTLCRASTGEGFSKRQLYTDDEDVIYSYRRCVILNGINIAATRADLLDRSILIGLDRIAPEKRREEEELEAAFEVAKPEILGGMFDVLSKAIRIRPEIKLKALPRMADFARWGCAIAQALGKPSKDFLDAYQRNIRQQNREVLDGQPVAAAVEVFMKNQEQWKGSPSELLEALEVVDAVDIKAKSWPKAPHILTRRLNEVQPNLAEVGIQVETGISLSHRRGIRICRISSVGSVVASEAKGDNELATDDTEREASDEQETASVSKSLDVGDIGATDATDGVVGSTRSRVKGTI